MTLKLPWPQKTLTRWLLAAAAALLVASLAIMAANYRFPSFFSLETPPDDSPGLMTTDTILTIGDDLFSNWLPNDVAWPTIFLDNPQNFQLGALEMLRYTARVMRDNLPRQRNSDGLDPDCDVAFTLLSNDPFKWYLPSAESRFKEAMAKYRSYRARLVAGQAVFSPRLDNLRELLEQYISLLGAINTRLANAPNSQRLKAGQSPPPPAKETAGGPDQSADAYVPWRKLDDNFYYAQGAAYVLRQMLMAVKYDFAKLLADRNAAAQLDNIIAVLDQSQFEPLWVANGGVGSILANHSMELHSLLENARQRLRNLNEMLGS
ncbi:MAG: DUF2333 family protein [Candidatus Adiutrix sp.]|jgi:hypothetical protein|nr:DUF2333 family protein [Candidatus Adiutrix sp.]